jgi:hypothetical protein
MVRSTKPKELRRGSGSGRASSPEKEATRRAKISESRRMKLVEIRASYRTKNRPRASHEGWDYREMEEDESFKIRSRTLDADKIRLELNRRYPRRNYYNVEVLD